MLVTPPHVTFNANVASALFGFTLIAGVVSAPVPVGDATAFAATDGCTTSMNGVAVMRVTGAKSLIGSYGSFLNRLGLTACVVEISSSV